MYEKIETTPEPTAQMVADAIGFDPCERRYVVARVSIALREKHPDMAGCEHLGCVAPECITRRKTIDAAIERVIDACLAGGSVTQRLPAPEATELYMFSTSHEARTKTVRVTVDVMFTEDGKVELEDAAHFVAQRSIRSTAMGMRRGEECAEGVQVLSVVGVSKQLMPPEHRPEFIRTSR